MNNLEIVHHPMKFKLDDTCRTCGAFVADGVLVPIFDQVEISTGDSLFQISEVLELMNIKISENDNLPQQICINCINELKNIHLFRDKCKHVQDVLREYFIESVIKTEIHIDDTVSKERQDLVKEEKPSNDVLNKNKVVTDDDESDEEIDPNAESYFAKESELLLNSRSREESNSIDKENSNVIIDTFESDEDLKIFVDKSSVNENQYTIFNAEEKPKLAKCENCLFFAYKRQDLYHKTGCTAMQDIFSCYYCCKSYKEEQEVVNHIIETHPKDRPYLCPVCSEPFDMYQNCIKHVTENHNHIKFPFICDICVGSFKHLRILRQHKRKAHDTGNYECRICNKEFKNIHKFDYHIKSHNKDKRFKCKYCPKSFMQPHHLKDHEATHTGKRRYYCKECDKTFKNTSSYYIHKRGHNKELHYCEICKKIFSKTALVAHMEKHKNNEDLKDEIRYLCSVCGKNYATLISLQKHLYSHNPSLVPDKTIRKYNRTKKRTTEIFKKYDCSFCDEKLSSLLGLQNHLKMHDENRKYKCEFCAVGYKRKEHLSAHINSKHTKIKKYYCSFCNKVFVSSTTKNSHEKSHLPDKNRCLYCSKTFKTYGRAKQHERTYHTKENVRVCVICNAVFTTYIQYRYHQVKKHSEEEIRTAKEKILTENLKSCTNESDNIEEEIMNDQRVDDS